MDIRELVRHLQRTASDRAVARELGVHRKTVQRYRAWAAAQGLLEGLVPPVEEMQALVARTFVPTSPPQTVSTVEPYRAQAVALYQAGVEGTAIWARLKERGYTGSLSAIYRFLAHLDHREPAATVRVERAPGEEAQVDFGSAGRLHDPLSGQVRKAWAFVMVLAWSRHQYVEFVFDQRVETWLTLHAHAFAFFGGVPTRVVIDNLKAGITQAAWEEPQVQAAYRECAEHYGFLIAPCRPRTPEHKGKVEQGGVHYVTRNFLGGREPSTLAAANAAVRTWCLETAGRRVHGTTKAPPLDRFAQVERAALQPLPPAPYDLARWTQATVHRDCYVVFEGSFYSVPFRLVGQRVRLRAGSSQVRIFSQDYALVAAHPRAQAPGERATHHDHLPPHKLPGLLASRQRSLTQAEQVGPACLQVVSALLADPVIDRVPTTSRLLRLAERYGAGRLEAACARALCYDEGRYPSIKRILAAGLDQQPPAAPVASTARTFARSAADLLGHLFAGGVTWN
jgi:transposase